MPEKNAKKFLDAMHALQGGTMFSDITMGEDKEAVRVIDDGLSRMAAYDGEIFRGLHFYDDGDGFDNFASLKAGDKLPVNGVTCWSAKGRRAKGFAHINDADEDSVIITCPENKSAVGTQHILKFGNDESEVTAKSDTKWAVKRIKVETKYEYFKRTYEAIEDPKNRKNKLATLEASGDVFKKRKLISLGVEEI